MAFCLVVLGLLALSSLLFLVDPVVTGLDGNPSRVLAMAEILGVCLVTTTATRRCVPVLRRPGSTLSPRRVDVSH